MSRHQIRQAITNRETNGESNEHCNGKQEIDRQGIGARTPSSDACRDAALGDPRARHDVLGRSPHRTAGQGYEQLGELAERVDLSTSPFAGDWSVSPVAKVPRRPGRG